MKLTDYISNDKITVKSTHTIQQVLAVFNGVAYTHVPVTKGNKLIGSVAKEDLITLDDVSQKLSEVEYLYEFFFAKPTDNLLELFSNYAVNDTSVLPVIDDDNSYVGYLDFNDLLGCFADTHFLSSEGSIVLLEKNSNAFSMSEVCQITESNSNTVLGCFVFNETEEKTQLTLKVKSVNINELIQSFRRYDYTILNKLTEDSYLEELKNRSEYFIKYLNI